MFDSRSNSCQSFDLASDDGYDVEMTANLDQYGAAGNSNNSNRNRNNSNNNNNNDHNSNNDHHHHSNNNDHHQHQHQQQQNEQEEHSFVRRETKLISRLKIMVIVVLIIAMIVVSTLAYRSVRNYEASLFQTRFKDDALSVINNFYQEETNRIRTTALAVNMYQIYSQFVGLPLSMSNLPGLNGFDYLGFSSASLAHSENIVFSPILMDGIERGRFERYASQLGDLLGDTTYHNRTTSDGIFEMVTTTTTTTTNDSDNNGTTTTTKAVNAMGPGPFSPAFQVYPHSLRRKQLLFDMMSENVRKRAIQSMMASKNYIMSQTLNPETELHLSTKTTEGAGSPTSLFFMPIFDAAGNVGGSSHVETDWRRSFANILPNDKVSISVVLENTCGETFTFVVRGDDVQLVGTGDHHDRRYDGMGRASSVNEFRKFWADQQTATPPDGYVTPLPPAAAADESAYRFGEDHRGDDDTVGCEYRIRLYPTEQFEKEFLTRRPVVYAAAVCGIFMLSALLFLVYDCLVEKRQTAVMNKAEKSHAIINGLFPKIVQERLFSRNDDKRSEHSFRKRDIDFGSASGPVEPAHRSRTTKRRSSLGPAKMQLRSILSNTEISHTTDHDGDDDMLQSAPIADLFPHTTVMFADIAGFTAWSSEREPAQVFILLETLYNEFDEIANKRGVFKVETIGDCYVAATGLPEPNSDHAVVLARFAWECLLTMAATCKRLEATLGPGTADLALRVGLHSGPTTAGVLRGEKSRFQLFGDTMNTASRMESNGIKNMVQVSESTAAILTTRGKEHWLIPRKDKIEAKGKGSMQTYWLRPTRRGSSASTASIDFDRQAHTDMALLALNVTSTLSPRHILTPAAITLQIQKLKSWSSPTIRDCQKAAAKQANLVDWNVEVLVSSLQKVVAMREHMRVRYGMLHRRSSHSGSSSSRFADTSSEHGAPIDELTGIIELPEFSDELSRSINDTEVLDGCVRDELRHYVSRIAAMYRDNPFHNFEHASHVTMSANKLMNRIVVPEDVDYEQGDTKRKEDQVALAKSVHNSTFGISSDPLAQFAIIFSALIHDIDHTGLTNSELVREEADVAVYYKGLSVAEQNSVTVAWGMLMQPEYERLCTTIFPTPSERTRFRQLVVNAVLATDIVDAKLTQLRKNRWDKAFHEVYSSKDLSEDMNRKATIVMEHIIQASDVAHSMQHWRIFCKWNEKLFQERYRSFLDGHEKEDPSDRWYENELWFFDNYVIPLANKLKECGVFGVSSDEYLGFATENRAEWEMKGKDVVHGMLQRISEKMTVVPNKASTLGSREPNKYMKTAVE